MKPHFVLIYFSCGGDCLNSFQKVKIKHGVAKLKYIKNKTIPDAIRQMIGFYPIKMATMDGNVLLVECTQKAGLHYKGQIVDEHGEAAEFANITLLSPTDSTIIGNGVSNENGYFVILSSKLPSSFVSPVESGSKYLYKPVASHKFCPLAKTFNCEIPNLDTHDVGKV